MTSHNTTPRFGTLAVLLGLITLIGSASIDMYLPFMPLMVSELRSDYAAMHITLMVFLISMGAGQLIFGPLIDAVGRRLPLLIALIVFMIASILASMGDSLNVLIVARTGQGLAAATVMVTAFSTVRDVAVGARAAQLFAILMTIQGLGPVIMPAVGGIIGSSFGWRAVFVSLAILGATVFTTSLLGLRETLSRENRTPLRPRAILRSYSEILADRKFLIAGLALSSVFIFLFAYVGGAPSVYQNVYGVSAQEFGFIFGATGIAVFFGAMGSVKLVTLFKVEQVAFTSTLLILIGALVSLSGLFEGIGLAGIVVGMFIALIGLGAGEATLMAIALSTRSTLIGTSAALLGAAPLTLGAFATPLAAWFAETGTLAWISLLIASAAISTLLAAACVNMINKSGVKVSLQH